MNISKLVVVAAFSLCASLANAAPISWTLSGVTFDDGGTASGTFTTDSVGGGLLGFDITTTAGSAQGGFHYDSSSASFYANNYFAPHSFIITRNAPFAEPFLNFIFASSLDTVGTIALITAPGGLTTVSGELSNTSSFTHRFVVAGYASSEVPEPESLALLTLALLGIAATRKRN